MAEKDELKKLKAAAGQCKAQVSRLERYMRENEGEVSGSKSEVVAKRISALEKTLEQYREIQLKINLLENKVDEADFMEDNLEDRYYELCARFANLKNKTPAPSTSHQRNGTSKLPHLELPTFTGEEITKYKPFLELFTAIIDRDPTLAPVQKLYYLKTHLKKEAEALIEGLPLCDSSFEEAKRLLNERYDNPAIIITSHVNQILDYPNITRGTASNLRDLVSHVRQHLGALKNMNQDIDAWNMLLLSIIMRKLDQHSARQYHMDRNKENLPTVDSLLSYLENRAASFEESQKQVPFKKHFEKSQVSMTNLVAKQKSIKCVYCQNDNHKLFACPTFKLISVKDRISFVRANGLCFVCMNNHTKKCILKLKCTHCKSKEHNTLLHLKEEEVKESSPEVKVNMHSSLPQSTVLLPTIKMKVLCEDGTHIIARGLLDTGSQTSFITQNLTEKLKIKNIFKNDLNIVTLGQKSSPVQQAAMIKISNLNDTYTESVLCSIVNKITCPLPQQHVVIKNTLPPSLMLADDGFNEPGVIDVLLSADVFFDCIIPGQLKMENGPLLINTKFGWVVSGKVNNASVNVTNNCAVTLHCSFSEQESLSQLVERFWETETAPLAAQKESSSKETAAPTEEDMCEEAFKASTTLENAQHGDIRTEELQLPGDALLEDAGRPE